MYQLLELYPHYHWFFDPIWEVKIMKGPFIGTFYSKKLTWRVEGIGFDEEFYDPEDSCVHLSAARLGLVEKYRKE